MTIEELWQVYPDNDLLPLDPDHLSKAEVEAQEGAGLLGDTLFLFLVREICDPADPVEREEACRRLRSAIDQMVRVRDALEPPADGEEDTRE